MEELPHRDYDKNGLILPWTSIGGLILCKGFDTLPGIIQRALDD